VVASNGDVWVANGCERQSSAAKVLRFSADGRLLNITQKAGLCYYIGGWPTGGFTLDHAGRLYLTSMAYTCGGYNKQGLCTYSIAGSNVTRVSSVGDPQATFYSDGDAMQLTTDLTIDADGRLLVADYSTRRIFTFTPDSEITAPSSAVRAIRPPLIRWNDTKLARHAPSKGNRRRLGQAERMKDLPREAVLL